MNCDHMNYAAKVRLENRVMVGEVMWMAEQLMIVALVLAGASYAEASQ